MRRYDCVMLRDELGLLEARMSHLDELVDVFVVVQGDRIFGTGEPRAYSALDARFEPWADRIRTLNVSIPAHLDAWGRERFLRDSMALALSDAAPTDVVILGDVDEFPTVQQVTVSHRGPLACQPRHMVFAPNLEHPTRHRGTIITPRAAIDSMSALRDRRNTLPVADGGFHFSWMPNNDGYRAKLAATSHTEFARENIDEYVARRQHLDGGLLCLVDVDETWPMWFRDGRCPESWWA